MEINGLYWELIFKQMI